MNKEAEYWRRAQAEAAADVAYYRLRAIEFGQRLGISIQEIDSPERDPRHVIFEPQPSP